MQSICSISTEVGDLVVKVQVEKNPGHRDEHLKAENTENELMTGKLEEVMKQSDINRNSLNSEKLTLESEIEQWKERNKQSSEENKALTQQLEELVKIHNTEIARMNKEVEDIKASSGPNPDQIISLKEEFEDVKNSLQTEIDQLRKTLAIKQAEEEKLRNNNSQLKKIGQSFRSKFQAEEKRAKELEEENQKLKDQLNSLIAQEGASGSEAETESEEES